MSPKIFLFYPSRLFFILNSTLLPFLSLLNNWFHCNILYMSLIYFDHPQSLITYDIPDTVTLPLPLRPPNTSMYYLY